MKWLAALKNLFTGRSAWHPTTGWTRLGGRGRAKTGELITRENALLLPAVWQAVSMISADAAKLPLDLYRRTDAGDGREIQRTHPAQRLVRNQANQEQTAKQFWRQHIGDALVYNNAYAWIDRDPRTQRPRQLLPLLPDRTAPDRLSDGTLVYVSEIDRRLETFAQSDVFHLRGLMLTDALGASPNFLWYARDAIALSLAAQEFESRFFKNGMRTSGVLEIPAQTSGPARENLERSFREQYESKDNWFKTLVLREGAKFHSFNQNTHDSEAPKLREDQIREIARLYKLPPSKLGLSDSVSYNSKSEDNQAYHDTTLSPWLDAIADECWFKLLTPSDREQLDLYFEHNTSALLRMNLLARFQAYEIAVNPNRGGFMTRSEIRRRENLPANSELDAPPAAAESNSQPTPKPTYGPNEARDRWLVAQRPSHTLPQLADKLRTKAKATGWKTLGRRGIQEAIKRYEAYQTDHGRPRKQPPTQHNPPQLCND